MAKKEEQVVEEIQPTEEVKTEPTNIEEDVLKEGGDMKMKSKPKMKKYNQPVENTIKVDLSKHLILKNKKEFKINSTEKTILELMINSPGKSFSRDEIGKIIKIDKERSIDVVITRLRKKIEEDPKNPKYLQTLRGEGYVLWIE